MPVRRARDLDWQQLHAAVIARVALIAVGAIACGDVLPPTVTAVTVTPSSTNLIAGETVQLDAETRVEGDVLVDDRVIEWTTSDATVASVSSTGLVSALAPGVAVTITATSEGQSAGAEIVVTGPPVTMQIVNAPRWPMIIGAKAPLVADLRDANGTEVVGPTVTWTSTNALAAPVSAKGEVTAKLADETATIHATYGELASEATVTTVPGIVTGIKDIHNFIRTCPDADPVFAQIKSDFVLRENAVVLTKPLACGTTYAMTPTAQMTDELIAYQVLRIAYYMSEGTEGKLPWTQLSLYAWMKSAIGGINFKTEPGQLYCCDLIEGKRYFSMSRLDDFNRGQKRDWPGLALSFDFFLHEIRHTDGPGHTTGCPAFPNASGPAGCDATYDLAYLGSYGMQYWLNSRWASSFPVSSAVSVAFSAAQAESESAANRRILVFMQGTETARAQIGSRRWIYVEMRQNIPLTRFAFGLALSGHEQAHGRCLRLRPPRLRFRWHRTR